MSADPPKSTSRRDDEAKAAGLPLELQHTPAHGAIGPFGVAPYVRAKLAEAQRQVEDVARAAAQEAAQEAAQTAAKANGIPVVPKALTPWFLAGLTLCGSVTATCFDDPDVPRWILKTAAVGTLFFMSMLGIGPGLWKRTQ